MTFNRPADEKFYTVDALPSTVVENLEQLCQSCKLDLIPGLMPIRR